MTNNQLTHKQFFNAPAVQEQFSNVLKGAGKQFTTSILSVIQTNGQLRNATNESIMTAAMKAAVLNLPIEPSLGYAYIVSYGNQAQFQLGYKGLIQLAQRSGLYKSINAGPVYKSQLISYNPLFEELELDFSQPQDEIVGYFAAFKLLNGFEKVTYWTKEKATAHGKRFSKSFNKGPWKTDFDAMAQKTALKDILSKYGPLSVEMQEAIQADNEDSTVSDSPVDVTPSDEPQTLTDLLESPETSDDKPNHNPETGEIYEEVTLLEGNTTKVKEG